MPPTHGLPASAADGVARILNRLAVDLAVEQAFLVIATDDGFGWSIDNRGATAEVPANLLVHVERVVERGGMVMVDDVLADGLVDPSVAEPGCVLAMAASDTLGALLGVVCATGSRPRSWTNRDIERTDDVTAVITGLLSVERLRRHSNERVNAEVTARHRRHQMHQIANQAASASSVTEIGAILVGETPGLLGAEWALVALRTVDETWLVNPGNHSGSEELRAVFAPANVAAMGLLEHAALVTSPREDISSETFTDWIDVQSAFLDGDALFVTVVPLINRPGELTMVMLCGFRDAALGLRTDLIFDEFVADATRAITRAADAQRVMETASTLQRSLLPPQLPRLENFEIRSLYNSASNHSRVGGDWYDVVQLDDDRFGFVVGDVAGHDVRSAAQMGQLRHVLASQLRDRQTPSGALASSDRYFADVAENLMATVVVAVVDSTNKSATFASAGHPPPVTILGGVTSLATVVPGPPVGFGYGGYNEHEIAFRGGDTMVLYTDGVVERQTGDITDHLSSFVLEIDQRGRSVDEIAKIVSRRADEGELVDDVAALIVRMGTPAFTS